MAETNLRTIIQPPPSITATLATGQGPSGPPGPSGTGDMHTLIYDPGGRRRDCFDLANLSGNLDGGTFT